MKIKNTAIIAAVGLLTTISGVANAGTAYGTGGATFEVGNSCTVTGAVVNMGSYSTGLTFQAVANDWGFIDGNAGWALTDGTKPIETLATVNCTSGTPYNLYVAGGDTAGSMVMSNGASVIGTLAHAYEVDGVALAAPVGLGTAGIGYSGVGTGADQIVKGRYVVIGWNGVPSPLTGALVQGTYTGTANVQVNY